MDLNGKAPSVIALFAARLLATAYILIAVATGCSTTFTYATEKYREMDRCKTELKRRVSTKEDVQRIFGPPDGRGSTVLAGGKVRGETWFYYDLKASIDTSTYVQKESHYSLTQQSLMVFFDKEIFDGYVTYSSAGTLIYEFK
jgi:hypothetical protein